MKLRGVTGILLISAPAILSAQLLVDQDSVVASYSLDMAGGNYVQSFTPTEDNVAAIGILIGPSPSVLPIDLVMNLYDGLPTAGGDLLATASAEVDFTNEFVTVDFSSPVFVTPGQTYYFQPYTAFPADGLVGIGAQPDDPYPGGELYLNGQPFTGPGLTNLGPGWSMYFDEYYDASPSPEPSYFPVIFAILVSGFVIIRRQRRGWN